MPRNSVRKHPAKTTGESTRSATGAAQPTTAARPLVREAEPIAVAPTKAPAKPTSREKCVVNSDKSSSFIKPVSLPAPNTPTETTASDTTVPKKRSQHARKKKGDGATKHSRENAEEVAVELSSAKPEVSSVPTIPPVSQKLSQQQKKAAPNPPVNDTAQKTSTPPSHTHIKVQPIAEAQPSSNSSTCTPQSSGLVEQNDQGHSPSSSNTLPFRDECIDFVLGRCQKGDKCHRLHLHKSTECVTYKLGFCPRRSKCPRTHVPLQEECRQFRRGRCPRGDECPWIHDSTAVTKEERQATTASSDTSTSSAESTPPSTPPTNMRDLSPISASPVGAASNVIKIDVSELASGSKLHRELPATQDDSGREVCRLYLANRCKMGERCSRVHPPRYEWCKFLPHSTEFCQKYIEGRCFLGENCIYRHPPSSPSPEPKEMRPSASKPSEEEQVPRQAQPPMPSNRNNKPHLPQKPSSPLDYISKARGPSSEKVPILLPATARASPVSPSQGITKPSEQGVASPALAPISNAAISSPSPPQQKTETNRAAQVCFDWIQGRCSRLHCKFSHEKPACLSNTASDGVDRLLNLLEHSVGEMRAKARTVNQRIDQTIEPMQPGQSGSRSVPSQTIPEVPPGLGLGQNTSPSKIRDLPLEGPSTMSVNVLDSVRVTFGPGFAVQEVITGFESKTIILKNIPSHVTVKMLWKALTPFGEVLNVQVPENRVGDGTMTVKASYASHTSAATASASLDGATLFKACVTARLASHQSTSLGKGTVRDGDVYLELPAPGRDAFVGYSTLEGATRAVESADNAEMGQSILSASIYQGVPKIGSYNVRIRGLPPDTAVAELEAFGDNEGVMLARCNYQSLDACLRYLQAKLEECGELVSIKVISPPFINQTIRAWAHFTTPSAADEACKRLHNRRSRFGRLAAQHVMSITYQIPNRVFDFLADNIRYLRSCVCTAKHRCDIFIYSKHRAETGSVAVKLTAETLPTLTRLKTSFEGILRGETVKFDGRAAWDSFFARASGTAFIAGLEAAHPGVNIQVDLRRCCIRLFGAPYRTWRVRQAIQAQMVKLSSQKTHSLPLDGNLIGFFMNSDLLKLQQELGSDNVRIDPYTLSLKVRGSKDAVQVASLIIQRARRRQLQPRKQAENGCPICLDEVSLPITLDCGHTWCKSCLTNYLRTAVDTKSFPLNCLGSGARCSHQIPLKIAHRILSSEDFQRLAHASFLAYIHSRPTEFHYCPTPDCPQVYRSAPPDTVLQCPSCLVRICGNCHVEYHEGQQCPDPETEEIRVFEEWTNTRDVKRCPGCKTYIERDAGCNHMTCTRCRTHICWVCLETFPQGDLVYDHMHAAHGGIGL